MRGNRLLVVITTASIMGAAIHSPVAAQKVPPINVDKKGVALHGYDPVSYFEADGPSPGRDSFSYSAHGATWRFVSAENRKKFAQDQAKFTPQYGGYCAYAVSENRTADVDPLTYKIVEGKLYLNYDVKIQRTWEKDIPGRIARADKNWPGLHEAE